MLSAFERIVCIAWRAITNRPYLSSSIVLLIALLTLARFRTADDKESGRTRGRLVREKKKNPRDREIGVIAGCCVLYGTWRRFRWHSAARARADFSFSPVIFAAKRKTSRHAHATYPRTLVSLESRDHERPPSRFLALGAAQARSAWQPAAEPATYSPLCSSPF